MRKHRTRGRAILLFALLAVLVTLTPAAALSGKSIDVDLSARQLVACEGGRVIVRVPVTTGTAAHPVTPGQYHVTVKHQRAYYPVGNDTAVQPWVLALDGGGAIMGRYYMHRWGHIAEHNILTLPNGDARRLWNWAAVGTPVTIH